MAARSTGFLTLANVDAAAPVTVCPHASSKIVACPVVEATAKEKRAITRKIIVMTKDKSPYGIAKQGFLNFPVAHPRQAIRIPTTPSAIAPFPMLLA